MSLPRFNSWWALASQNPSLHALSVCLFLLGHLPLLSPLVCLCTVTIHVPAPPFYFPVPWQTDSMATARITQPKMSLVRLSYMALIFRWLSHIAAPEVVTSNWVLRYWVKWLWFSSVTKHWISSSVAQPGSELMCNGYFLFFFFSFASKLKDWNSDLTPKHIFRTWQ